MNEDDDDIDADAPQADSAVATAELDDPELADEEGSGGEEAAEVTTHGNLKDDEDG